MEHRANLYFKNHLGLLYDLHHTNLFYTVGCSRPVLSSMSDESKSKRLMEFAVKAAETFVSAYYAASDSPQRVQIIPTLYLSDSSVVWNGTPISGATELANMLSRMPGTKHELHGFDCHPLGGDTFVVPSLVLNVFGTVAHHTPDSLSARPSSNAPASTSRGSSAKGKGGGGGANAYDPDAPLTSLARAYSQSFILTHKSGTEGGVNCSVGEGIDAITGKFFVQADTMRFVG